MYSNRSPPTVSAGMDFPYMSMPTMLGIVPFTGMRRSRKYWSMVGNVYAFVIKELGYENAGALPPLCPTVTPALIRPFHRPNSVHRVRVVPGFVIARERLPSGCEFFP